MKKFKLTALLSMALLLTVSCNNENLERNSIQEETVETKDANMPAVCRIGLDESGMPSQPFEVTDAMLAEVENEVSTKADGEYKYYIPVIFHVFGVNQGSGQITSDRLQQVLDWINNDFHGKSNAGDIYNLNRLNADRKQYQENFPDIIFELAKYEPDGKKMDNPGIIVYPVNHPANRAGLGNSSANGQISKIAWDNKRYMNVYITNDLYADGVTNNSGVSWYPGTSGFFAKNCDRVVYNGAYLPKTNTKYSASGADFTSVITHEFGHFMNLAHTFNEGAMYNICDKNIKDGGSYGDKVADTPQMLCSSNFPEYDGFNKKNCAGEIIDYGNFMNYGVYCNFTKGQVTRMKAALNHSSRRGLWKDENLITTLGPDYKGDNGNTEKPEPPVTPPAEGTNVDRINNGETVIIDSSNNLFPKMEDGTTLTIYNTKGSVVYEESDYQGNFNMQELPQGSYFYAITKGSSVRKGSVEVI